MGCKLPRGAAGVLFIRTVLLAEMPQPGVASPALGIQRILLG